MDFFPLQQLLITYRSLSKYFTITLLSIMSSYAKFYLNKMVLDMELFSIEICPLKCLNTVLSSTMNTHAKFDKYQFLKKNFERKRKKKKILHLDFKICMVHKKL